MGYGLQKIVTVTTRNNVKLIPLTCEYVKSFASGIGMSEEKTERLVRLTEMTLERRMIHAYQGTGEITLDILAGLDRIRIDISDRGMPYWIDRDREKDNIPVKPDEFVLQKMGKDGQKLCMTFFLEPEIDILAYKKQDDVGEELLDSEFHARRAGADDNDINEIMKCIYYNFGYMYPNQHIYEPAHVKKLIEDGRLWSFLAQNGHGQTMAHVSLAFHEEFPGMPEIGSLVCKQFSRGHNVGGRIVSYLCGEAQRGGVAGAFAVPVAFHPISQKIFRRQGFVPTGMILHYLPSECAWDYGEGDRRLDMFVCARMFSGKEKKRIFVPEKHAEFISGIYGRLEVPCECISEVLKGAEADESVYSVSYDHNIRTAEVMIECAGEGFEEELTQVMQECYRNGMELVKVYLNISGPSAPGAYEVLEKNVFYFSGILPGCESGEYLMMGHLMGIPMEWDKITAVEGYDEMLEYIRAHF